MAVTLSALHTGHTLLSRNIIIFMFLVLISVRSWVNPRAQSGREDLVKLKKKIIGLIRSRTRDLPAYSIVPELLHYCSWNNDHIQHQDVNTCVKMRWAYPNGILAVNMKLLSKGHYGTRDESGSWVDAQLQETSSRSRDSTWKCTVNYIPLSFRLSFTSDVTLQPSYVDRCIYSFPLTIKLSVWMYVSLYMSCGI
jgi:hypothetical protein